MQITTALRIFIANNVRLLCVSACQQGGEGSGCCIGGKKSKTGEMKVFKLYHREIMPFLLSVKVCSVGLLVKQGIRLHPRRLPQYRGALFVGNRRYSSAWYAAITLALSPERSDCILAPEVAYCGIWSPRQGRFVVRLMHKVRGVWTTPQWMRGPSSYNLELVYGCRLRRASSKPGALLQQQHLDGFCLLRPHQVPPPLAGFGAADILGARD